MKFVPSGEILIRTLTQSLSASGSVVLALIVAPSTVPPAQVASIVVLPAVGELMVTVQVPAAPVVQSLFDRDATTHWPASAVHTPSTTDFSSVMVSTWFVPASLSSFNGEMLIRTFTQSLFASPLLLPVLSVSRC